MFLQVIRLSEFRNADQTENCDTRRPKKIQPSNFEHTLNEVARTSQNNMEVRKLTFKGSTFSNF